jgi:hypothetical protein
MERQVPIRIKYMVENNVVIAHETLPSLNARSSRLPRPAPSNAHLCTVSFDVCPNALHVVLDSGRLDDLGWAHVQLSAEHPVPESACDAETILVVSKVVLEVILLELLVVWGQSMIVSSVRLSVGTRKTYFWWWRK